MAQHAAQERWNEFNERARGEIDARLRGLGLSSAPAVLADVPTRANWGDGAIWAGELAACAALQVNLVDQVDRWLYDRRRVRDAVGDGILLLHGGGSLGDLYPVNQEFREVVLSQLRDVRIVQLPQSIWFEHDENLARARRAVDAHPDFTLLVRDRPSLDYARQQFDCAVHLMPDMAFALGPLERPIAPDVDVIWLHRSGREAATGDMFTHVPPGVVREDWSPANLPRRLVRRLLVPIQVDAQLRKVQARSPLALKGLRPVRRRFVPRIGVNRAQLAAIFLARGRAVITDRLHGHILCVLLGIPHVLVENRIGKLGAYFDTWTHDAGIGQMAANEGDAVDAALALAANG